MKKNLGNNIVLKLLPVIYVIVVKIYCFRLRAWLVKITETSNDIIAGNGRILGLRCYFIVVVNCQRQNYVLIFF